MSQSNAELLLSPFHASYVHEFFQTLGAALLNFLALLFLLVQVGILRVEADPVTNFITYMELRSNGQ